LIDLACYSSLTKRKSRKFIANRLHSKATKEGRREMKQTLILIIALSFSISAHGSGSFKARPSQSERPVTKETSRRQSSAPCAGNQLSVRHLSEDAAMGGHRSIDYAFTNTSSSSCTLFGYPRFELLNKSGRHLGRVRVVNSNQLPGQEEKQPPRLVRLEPNQKAWFRVYYNSGGAGYIGKPCPAAARVRIAAPGAKRAFILRDEIQSCRQVEVSAVRSEQP
jgi:hypothetical protein